jgi:hypothetical protein
MKQRKSIEVIGMPFLDMISCAFGGLIILYILAEHTHGNPEPFPLNFKVVSVKAKNSLPVRIGIQLTEVDSVGGENVFKCVSLDCSNTENIIWDVQLGETLALIKGDLELRETIGIAIVDSDAVQIHDRAIIQVCVDFYGARSVVDLSRDYLFRSTSNIESGEECD